MAQSEISKATKKTVENHDAEEEFGPQLISKLQVNSILCNFKKYIFLQLTYSMQTIETID